VAPMEKRSRPGRAKRPMRRVGGGLLRAALLLVVLAAVGPISNALAEPPSVTIGFIPSPTSTTSPTIEGTAGTAEGDESTVSVTLLREGSVTASGKPSVSLNGEWEFSPGHLSDGTYTVQATQRNEAGETGSAERSFRIDSTPPKVTINSVAPVTKIATPAFGGAAGTEEGDQGVFVTIHELKPEARTIVESAGASVGGGAWSYTAPHLADGTYTAQAAQGDSVGNVTHTTVVTFKVETVSPKVTLEPVKTPSNNKTPSFKGTATNTTSVTVNIYAGATATGTPVATATATGTEKTWTSGTASPALKDGEYTATATQPSSLPPTEVPAGTSPPIQFVVNTVAPTVTLVSPASPSPNTKPSFKGTASDTKEPVTVKIYLGASEAGTPVAEVTAPAPVAGAWTSGPSPELKEGIHEYTAVATQKSSVENPTGKSPPVHFIVNTKAPLVILNAPPPWSNNPALAFSGTASESTPVTVSVYAGPQAAGPVVATATAASGGVWSSGPTSPALIDGQYTAKATQTSKAGEPGGSLPVTFMIDTVPPAVTLSSPANGSSTASGSELIAGSAGTAAIDLPEVTVQVFSGGAIAAGQAPLQSVNVPAVGGAWATTVAGLGPGAYTVRALQSDQAGNVGVSAARTFTVLGGSTATRPPPTAAFTWVPSSPHTGENVSLLSSSTDAASPITSYAWDLAGSGAFAAGGPVMNTSFSTPGKHLVQLRVGDAGGLSSVASAAIEVTIPLFHLMRPFPIVRITATRVSSGVRLKLLSVQASSAARITVACRGHGCPVKSQTRAASAGKVKSGLVEFRRLERFLPAGVTLEIRVSKPGVVGKFTRFGIRHGRPPARFDACLPPAKVKPMSCPSS
jgi:hypothetical protein